MNKSVRSVHYVLSVTTVQLKMQCAGAYHGAWDKGLTSNKKKLIHSIRSHSINLKTRPAATIPPTHLIHLAVKGKTIRHCVYFLAGLV